MMSSSTESDPFLQVQADVLAQLSQTRPLYTSYLRIRSLTPSNTSTPELISARADLETALSTLAEDLSDLLASITAVSRQPSRYGLSSPEVARRKTLVDDVGAEVEAMRQELLGRFAHSQSQSQIKAQDQRPAYDAEDDGFINQERDSRDYTTEFAHAQQQTMLADQDVQLDGVFRTVGNLRQQADSMGRELEEQREMLEVVDGLADRVGGRLGTGMKRMGEVVRANEDGLSSCCIGVLIFVLILLLVLVLIL